MGVYVEKLLKLQAEREEKARKKKDRELKKTWQEPLVARYLKKCVEEAGGMCVKMHPLTNKGIPDYLVHIHKRTFYVETKTTGKLCEPAQVEYQKLLKAQGIETYVLDTKITNFWDLYIYAYKTYVDPNNLKWGINRRRKSTEQL